MSAETSLEEVLAVLCLKCQGAMVRRVQTIGIMEWGGVVERRLTIIVCAQCGNILGREDALCRLHGE